MIGTLRAALLAALLSASLPAVAVAQMTATDSLLHRIDVLERTTTDLEWRVRELEALIKGEPALDRPIQASSKSRDLQNWRRLRRGMTMDEVRALLGEPERVDAMGELVTFWRWGSSGATVQFDGRSNRVNGWSEPRH